MSEYEYMLVTDRVRISNALAILRDVLAGSDYSITQKEKSEVMCLLYKFEDRMFKEIENLEIEEGK